jgi:hypothetical protein
MEIIKHRFFQRSSNRHALLTPPNNNVLEVYNVPQ